MVAKIELPKPTGPYPIGVMDFELTDEGREESFAPGTKRRIPVRAWYPAASVSGSPRPYAKPAEMEHVFRARAAKFSPLGAGAADMYDVPTHAYEDAAVLKGERHPVLIFSHGGFVYLQSNTALMEHLASHGYVVLSITHPYVAMTTLHENGDIVPFSRALFDGLMASAGDSEYIGAYVSDDPAARLEFSLRNAHESALAPHFLVWEQDFLHMVDRLHKGDLPPKAQTLLEIIDVNRLGVFGMSFGASGSAAAQRDTRIRAAINLDGGVFDPDVADIESRVPLLVMHADRTLSLPGKTVKPHSEFYYERLASAGTRSDIIRVETKGSTHMDYTDHTLMPTELKASIPAGAAGTIDGVRMAQIVNDFCKCFFDFYLSGQGAGLDSAFRSRYPEVADVDLSAVRAWAATNPKPGFMSYRHVQIMNRLLAADEKSHAAAAALDRLYILAYELTNGPKGQIVWWQMRFDPKAGISFALSKSAEPADLVLQGDWAAMMRTMHDVKAGRPAEPPLTPIGNADLMDIVGAAFAAGSAAATIHSIVPEV